MAFEKTAVPHLEDTIVAVSTAAGGSRRAVVRVGGPAARAVVAAVFTPQAAERPRHLTPGVVRLSGIAAPLPAVLYFFAGPRSYTGQDVAELHTLGSPPLVERLVGDLLAAGARPARPGEFTLRAFLAGKLDLPRAEAVQAVVTADTDAELHAALAQLAGGVSRPLQVLRDDLLDLLADLEAALDFADEDIEFVGRDETLARLDAAMARLTDLLAQLEGRTVSGRPVRVALVGLPNAGKSSLFNALTGGQALVSPHPGTTRDYLTARLDLDGLTVELIDTAGWEPAADRIAEQAQRLGREAAAGADVVLWCDESGRFDAGAAARLVGPGTVVIRVRTKADLAGPPPAEAAPRPATTADIPVACSVRWPGGTDAVRAALRDHVQSLIRAPGAPSLSRCRHHLTACLDHLRAARAQVAADDPPELAAAALRAALEQLGELTGAVYTNDLLDRIFSRFCIGK